MAGGRAQEAGADRADGVLVTDEAPGRFAEAFDGRKASVIDVDGPAAFVTDYGEPDEIGLHRWLVGGS